MSSQAKSSDSKPEATRTPESPVNSLVVICESSQTEAAPEFQRVIDLAGRMGIPPEKIRVEDSLESLQESAPPDLTILVDRPSSELMRARGGSRAVWRFAKSRRPEKRMLVAVGSGTHSSLKAVDRRAVELAMQLAQRLELELHAVTAWKPPLFRSYQLEAEARASVSVFRRLALRRSRKTARRLEIPPDRWHVREGPFEEVVSEMVTELEPYVIVVGTRGRQGLVRLLFGSRVAKVLQAVPERHVLSVS